MSDLADSLLAGMRAAPNLDPSIVYGISNTVQDPSQVPDIAQGTQAFADSTRQAQFLRTMDKNHQIAAWSAAGDTQRQMLTAAGYQPPVDHGGGGGILGAIGRGLGDVAHAALVTPTEAIGHGVSELLHVAGAPLRGVQHAFRAASLITDESVGRRVGTFDPGALATSLGASLSPSEWAKAWRESEHGEQTFSPVAVRQIASKYDQETNTLAQQIASSNVDRVILGAPEDQRQALAQRIASDPELKTAVGDYEAAKITLGHRILGPSLTARMQVTLPSGVPLIGGAKFNPISGGIDALGDWFGDPLVIGGKAAKGAELARYLVQTPEDVDRLVQANTNVQRALADVTETLNHGGPAALAERWPSLSQVAPTLAQQGVDSPTKLVDWFKGQAGMSSLLSGRATGASVELPQMLKLNPREAAMLNLKGGLKSVIDWAADTPLVIAQATGDEAQAGAIRQFAANRVQGMGRLARQATSLTARGFAFDPADPNAVTQIQRLANYVLPAERTRDVVNAWSLADTLDKKRDIYKGLLGEMFDAAGITATEDGRKWATEFLSNVDEGITKPVYSASGADTVRRDGVEAKAGLLEPHLTTEWAMPPFKDLWAQAKRANTLGRVYQGTITNDGISRFMESVWKPTTLLRLGFPVRAGGEELVAAIMREGPLGLIRGRLAAGAAQGEAAGVADRILPFHPLQHVWEQWIAPKLPNELAAKIEQPSDYIAATFADRTRRAFRSVEGALAGDRYMDAARELWDRGPLQDAFLSEVSAVHGHSAGGYLDDQPTIIKAAKSGDNPRPAYFAPVGGFKNYAPEETLYTAMWRKNLAEVADSQLGRAALAHVDDPEAARQAVADVLDSPGFAKMRARASRNLYTTDGRIVGVDATADEATRDWANAVVDHVNSIVQDANGQVIGDLPAALLDGEVPTVTGLAQTPIERMPEAVKGREVVPVSRNWVRDTMDRGFTQVVGRPMDWMVRQPLFIHNYAQSLEEAAAPLRAGFGASESIDEVAHNVAMERAINKTIPFIHDPQMKSQFSVVTRNLAPFWFAQEQFYKRWSKILIHSPESFRQAQLVMSGLRHSGVLHTDDQGNDYFIYPGASAVQNVITRGLELLPGQAGKWKVPLPVGFSGQVRFATPGLERLGAPSFGPLVGIPMHAMASMFPELDPVEQGVLGERGAGRAYWEQITPTTVSRLIHLAVDKPDTSPQMASAMMQAMQYLEATGNGPPDSADPNLVTAWQDKVRNWTRILFLNRMLFGFGVPASPELQMDPDELHGEFRDLMKTMPIEQAVQEFMRRHPDATAYTVFQSKSASGAPLPATADSAQFMADHQQFLETYPQAGGWFLPQTPPKDGEFSLLAYREQLGMQLRQQKSPTQFYNDLKYTEAADQYFRSRDKKDAALADLKGNPARANDVRSQWSAWKTDFLQTHPIFATELQDPAAQIRRQQTVDQLHQALQDPRAPKTPQTAEVATMVRAYDQINAVLVRLGGLTSATAQRQRQAVRDQFNQWGTQYITDHPDVKPLWDRTFRFVAEGTMN